MQKKRVIHTEDITEKEILSLYYDVLPLLYSNLKKLDPITEIKNGLNRYIAFDSFYYLMDDPKPPLQDEKFSVLFERYDTGKKDELTVKPLIDSDIDEPFFVQTEKVKKKMIEVGKINHPDKPYCHYYRILSTEYPKIMVEFLRFGKSSKDKAFTKEEEFIFDKLAPYIQILFRIVLAPGFNSGRVEYFKTYIDICSTIAHKHDLSGTESKFLPEILFGRSNEEIAEKNFISLPTVKKHLGNIFRKTETKNRVDFIGKFFTSPDRINF